MRGVTTAQLEVLRHARENPGIDFDQMLDKLSWAPSKESAQFVIRATIKKGLLEKSGLELRRGRRRMTYRLTQDGKLVFDPRGAEQPSPDRVTLKETLVSADFLEADLKDLLPGLPDLDGDDFSTAGGESFEPEIIES